MERLISDLEEVKQKRIAEKNAFMDKIVNDNKAYVEKQQKWKSMNIEHQDFIQNQIQFDD